VRIVLRAVSGFVVLAAAVVALAPATLLDGALAAHTGDRLHLVDARGLWWHGEGALATGDGMTRLPLAWHVAFVPLLTGKLVVALRAGDDGAAPTGIVTLAEGTVDVRDLHVVAPAALLPALVPAVKAVALRGDVDLRAPSFTWRGTGGAGTFAVTWDHARIGAGPLVVDLGQVTANGALAGDGLAGTVRGSGGDVTIDGTLGVSAGVMRASLELTPAPGAPDAVRAVLPLLGPVDQAGRVAIEWRSDPR
jgi:hypothetical protein